MRNSSRSISFWKLLACAVVCTLGVPPLAVARGLHRPERPELVIQFRSADDPTLEPDLSVCADAPFEPNLVLAASLFVPVPWPKTGEVVFPGRKRRGTGTACFFLPPEVVAAGFPPFSQADLFAEFEIGGVRVRADGVCTSTSNDVPQPGLILAGCALDVIDAPPGFVGGNATSNSTFNPLGLPGFDTGSFWTLRLFRE